jgi:hypothetical protein
MATASAFFGGGRGEGPVFTFHRTARWSACGRLGMRAQGKGETGGHQQGVDRKLHNTLLKTRVESNHFQPEERGCVKKCCDKSQ